jgi:hypothetical protein
MNKKILAKTAACSLVFAGSQVNADTISFYLDQSNDLLDGVNYAQVTISDSIDTAGDIDFVIELLDPAFTVSGSNFGMQDFSFNYDDALTIDEFNIINLSSSDWKVSQGKNAGGGFGKYDIQLSGTGKSRTEELSFTISGVDGDTINSYAMGSLLNPAADEFFATHIAGFDYVDGVTSAKFAGSSVVPVPASVWLFGSGLLGLAGLARRKKA